MTIRTPDEILSQLAEQEVLLNAVLAYGLRDTASSEWQAAALKHRLGLLAQLDEARNPSRKLWDDVAMLYSNPVSHADINLDRIFTPRPPAESTEGRTDPTEG